MDPKNSLVKRQKSFNASTRSNWDDSEWHRQQLTRLMLASKEKADLNLCVIGAGNCNDLNLSRLVTNFRQIHLVDIDTAALEQGVRTQGCDAKETIHVHGDCDATGIWGELAELVDSDTKDKDKVDRLLEKSMGWPGLHEKLGTFGTVVSTCILSQLIDGVVTALGESHPQFLDVVIEIRRRHLQLLCELTVPGGQVILITDFVSSDTAPDLPELDGEELGARLAEMIEQRNFFTGLNPLRLYMLLSEEPTFTPHIGEIEATEPWLWGFGERCYAVTAFSFQRI